MIAGVWITGYIAIKLGCVCDKFTDVTAVPVVAAPVRVVWCVCQVRLTVNVGEVSAARKIYAGNGL